MKRFFVYLMLFSWAVCAIASPDLPNGKTKEVIIHQSTGHQNPHIGGALPTALYYESTRMLTIEFEASYFESYVLSIESPYAATDYFVTTPFTSVYISPDVANVDLYMETQSGDLYWGSFEASSNTSME